MSIIIYLLQLPCQALGIRDIMGPWAGPGLKSLPARPMGRRPAARDCRTLALSHTMAARLGPVALVSVMLMDWMKMDIQLYSIHLHPPKIHFHPPNSSWIST
jgi:hypothetical protein